MKNKTIKRTPMHHVKLNVLVIDVGGTHVKVRCTGEEEIRKFPSGPLMTPAKMVEGVKTLTKDWHYDVISLGCPMPISKGIPTREPVNLGKGWLHFNFEEAFDHPVKVINDAAMQALGDYRGGRMLFLGFGTGLGSALIEEGLLIPLELAHLPYKKKTFEYHVGKRALEKKGAKKWNKSVLKVIEFFQSAFAPEEIVLGGGNSTLITHPPQGSRVAANSNAFIGGFRLWEHPPGKPTAIPISRKITPLKKAKKTS